MDDIADVNKICFNGTVVAKAQVNRVGSYEVEVASSASSFEGGCCEGK